MRCCWVVVGWLSKLLVRRDLAIEWALFPSCCPSRLRALIGAWSLQANQNPMEVNETRYIGIDVGKRRCQACVMDERGSIIDEFVFENSCEGLSYGRPVGRSLSNSVIL